MERVLTLEQAARHIHVDARELLHLAQRGEIPCRRRGDTCFFERRAVDEWVQRNIMSLKPKFLTARHRAAINERHEPVTEDRLIEALTTPEWIDPALPSRTRPGVIRDMVALALKTGLLYDDAILLQGIEDREQAASTAIGEGAAFLHTRYYDPYSASASFIVLGRTVHPIFFGAQDGRATDLFFLICCIDDELHIHVLARLCLLMHGTDLPERLRAATTAEEMYQSLLESEHQFLLQL